ncbi:hypothetical protein P43SY_008099 [Pythium insidiosum]|uniref:Adenylate kinase n=1 Tax=Pythium insidiosum TaxID=114742 RepID=A0AAD5Q7F8_PYTIN|nr:hypothetical protein P43SY_008099 [Pythium insidiosum]
MRVFISDLHSTLAAELTRYLQDDDHEVVGTVASKAQLAVAKRKLLEHPASDKPDAVSEPVALRSDRVAVARLVQRADIVITSLVADTKHAMELLKAFEKPPATDGDDDAPSDGGGSVVKRFLALSSVLTWSKNGAFAKGQNVGHSEDDFKTRKPARKYAELKTAETQILSAQRADELETCVVASGLQYGGAQSDVAWLFRQAWMYPNDDLLVPSLPGCAVPRGENLLPMISVYDLALLTFRLATAPSLAKSYVIATDRASQTTTLRDLCAGLSVLLGNGRVCDSPTDEQVDTLLVSDDDHDTSRDGAAFSVAPLQLHLCFDCPSETSVMAQLVPPEEFRHVDSGMLGHLAFFVQDFIAAMDLRPLKTVVLGPPRVGKSWLSGKLAKDYYLPQLTLASIVRDVLEHDVRDDEQQLDADANAEAKPEGSGDSDKPPTADDELRALRAALLAWRDAEAKEAMTEAALATLPEPLVVQALRWKLCSAACRNHGYVLDGLPVSVAQGAKVFELIKTETATDANAEDADADSGAKATEGGGDDAAESTEETDPRVLAKSRSKLLLDKLKPERQLQTPNRVIVLHAPRPLLEQRAQTLSEEDAIASNCTQAAFDARFSVFSAESEGLVTFFEQLPGVENRSGVEVLELHLDSDASFHDSERLLSPVQVYMEQGGKGKPNNFHPTREELKQMEREHARKRADEEAAAEQRQKEQDERDLAQQQARLAADKARLELIQREEAELLEARAKPLRTYLMDTVLPALTEGMLEVVKVQPDDPIDYLAEFLFKKGRELEMSGHSS